MPISINQLKPGKTILINGEIFTIQEYQHVKPGKGPAFVRTKIKNLVTEAVFDKTFKPDDKVAEAFIEQRKLIFQYRSGNIFHFMDQENYEEVRIDEKQIKNEIKFIKDNLEVNAFFFEKKLLRIDLPTFILFKVSETEPGIKGDTVKAGTKAAKFETGLIIQVPLFVNTDDVIKIDTRTGTYVERA